jgi:hypothetical protein
MSDRTGNILAFLVVLLVMASMVGVTGYVMHIYKVKHEKQFAVP